MRVAFVWDWEPFYPQAMTWQDGLSAALHELENRGHTVLRLTGLTVGEPDNQIIQNPLGWIMATSNIVSKVKAFDPDVILHFADMTRQNARPLFELGVPMAICFTGGDPLGENYPFFKHIFVESETYRQAFEKAEMPVSIAFGTNTDLFTPIESQPKLYDTIFPATFAAWKRHDLYASATRGLRSLAVGHMYNDHEQECWEECLRLGTMVLPYVSGETLRYLYAASKICVVPSMSSGGSQRTVLEAMAMNIPLIVTDSDKFDFANGEVYRCEPDAQEIRSYINAVLEDGEHEVNTREFILNKWSHKTYADALEKGLQEIAK